MALLYSNENFPLPAVVVLRRLGHDVLTIQETGNSDQAMPDDQVLAFAAAQQRAIVTLNRKHFVKLHQQSTEHAGIIVCTVDVDFVALARRIDAAVTQEADLRGKLIRINRSA
jgi:predicted nuclease of predicted toxin-antitoxin system